AMTFLLIALSVLAARPKVGWMALVTGSGPGGALVRLLLPALIAMLIAIGWLRVQGEYMGWFGPDLGITLYTVAVITLCVALTLWSAHSLDSAAAKQSKVERQREEAFSELKQSEARIRSIVDTAYDAFISIDADGRVIDWNVAAEKMFGYLRSECIGKDLSRIIIPERLREAHDAGLACARSPEGAAGRLLDRRVEMTALRRNGDEFPIQMTIWQLMIGANRTYNAFIGDITDRTIAERNIQLLNSQLITKASQLEISNRELEAFSYSISHDLRAPLRHIDGYAQMLAEDSLDQLDSEGRRYLDEIGAAARRMGALIDSLLAFSRLGRKPVQRTVVDMQALVEHVVREEFSAISTKISIDELPCTHADATLLKQVWVNLISNALKYSAPRGSEARIHISGERYPEFCRYQIRDNGVGFDMRYADKLFGVFQRLHTDDEFDGAGVGLAIVQRIVSRHDGTIEAQGEPGNGATFAFDLPGMAGSGHTVHAEERAQ
ncbi:sensor histidine kinase, partial [Dokdonella sp.]|uniref:sensor histidine kinase n=1 Tax=Dokdonella sp. TaxID=2291710 RepID=UPI003C3F247A